MAFKLLRLSNNFRTLSQRLASSQAHSADFQGALSAIPPTELSVTENNVKVASQNIGGETTTVGIWVNAGARNEDSHNNGVANLVDRLIFKGTSKQTQAQLEAEVASIGGRLYSFTSREKSAFYGTCQNKDVPKLVEILSNAVLNAKFSDEDLAKVRNELLRESDDVESNISDVVFDYLHATAYQGTPLAQTVIGTRENIQSLKSSDLRNFIATHYKASNLVVAAAGGVNHSSILQLANQHLGRLEDTFDREPEKLTKCRYTGSEVRLRDDALPFAHFAIAVESPGNNSPDRLPLEIATTALGSFDRGDAPTSAPQREICQSYKSFNISYNDTGLFGVYAVTEPMQCEDFAKSALDAWQRVANSITEAEINEAKNRLITNYLKQLDGSKGNCEDIGNSLLSYGRRIPLKELATTIANVESQTVRDVTEKIINNKCPVVAAVGPVENLSDYVNIRTRMYWARV